MNDLNNLVKLLWDSSEFRVFIYVFLMVTLVVICQTIYYRIRRGEKIGSLLTARKEKLKLAGLLVLPVGMFLIGRLPDYQRRYYQYHMISSVDFAVMIGLPILLYVLQLIVIVFHRTKVYEKGIPSKNKFLEFENMDMIKFGDKFIVCIMKDGSRHEISVDYKDMNEDIIPHYVKLVRRQHSVEYTY